MAKIRIEQFKGRELNLPILGLRTFDKEGILEMSEEEWVKFKELEGIEYEVVEDAVSDEVKTELENKTVKELKELLAGFPEEETKNLSLKKDIVDYLLKRLT